MKHKKNGKERAARVGCSARPKKTSIWYRGFVFFYSFRSFVRNVFLFFFAFIGTCVQVATQSGGSPARRKKKNTHKHQVPPPQKKEKTKKKTLIKQKKKKTAKEEPSKGEPWRARSSIKKNNNNKKKKKSGRPFDEPSSSFVFSLRSFFSSTSFFLLDFFSFLFFCFFLECVVRGVRCCSPSADQVRSGGAGSGGGGEDGAPASLPPSPTPTPPAPFSALRRRQTSANGRSSERVTPRKPVNTIVTRKRLKIMKRWKWLKLKWNTLTNGGSNG